MEYARVKDLTFSYDQEPVLKDINFRINSGEFVMLSGENGAAKTTLIRNMLGILQPQSGEVVLSEKNVEGEALNIGYIPQMVASFNAGFPTTVYELVSSGRFPRNRWFKALTEEDKDMIEKALDLVDMQAFRDAKVGDLSGGQKQRIILARAFAGNPDFYVLDEPTTGMDLESRTRIYEYLKEETVQRQKTVLIVSHDQDEVQSYVDRHVRLKRREDSKWRSFSLHSCKEPSQQPF